MPLVFLSQCTQATFLPHRSIAYLCKNKLLTGEETLIIAVDFDGTIVEHDYPRIGREMLFAFDTLKALQRKGHRLILWTYREGPLLAEAVEYCRSKGVEFYAVNKSYPEEVLQPGVSRKINADLFIDDRNAGGFPGWGQIFQMLHPGDGPLKHQLINPEAHHNFRKGSSVFHRILNRKSWYTSSQKKK